MTWYQRTKTLYYFWYGSNPRTTHTKSLFNGSAEEGELILKSLQPGDVIVLLMNMEKEMRLSRICRLYETKNEHSQSSASFHYRRPMRIFCRYIKQQNDQCRKWLLFVQMIRLISRGSRFIGQSTILEWRTVSSWVILNEQITEWMKVRALFHDFPGNHIQEYSWLEILSWQIYEKNLRPYSNNTLFPKREHLPNII